MHTRVVVGLIGIGLAACLHTPLGCDVQATSGSAMCVPHPEQPTVRVRPGITVLLEDSIFLVRDRRIGLLTNQSGIDERGEADIDLLRGTRARQNGVRLLKLFSPEHGIRGTEDRTHIESGIDARSGLPVHSLYTVTAIAPPDSLLTDLDALVFDLQDIGTRTWTYVGSMIYAMRAAARHRLPIIVLDRPNPITGTHVDGPMLDTALANAEEHTPQRPARPYALYPFPLRHGMTMGEMARFYNDVLRINVNLRVVPTTGWRRAMWLDETGLPYVKPSPNLPNLTSALIYPSLVAFEGTNVSVGRGTSDAFQRFGAPWLNADSVARLLNARRLPGVRFVVDPFTPQSPGDNKFNGVRVNGVRIDVTDRNAVRSGRLGAAILWAITRVHRDSLRINQRSFDERFGSSALRQAIVQGADPDSAVASQDAAVTAFRRGAQRFRLYR
jgi:uncharacterized protein YbbC (DUF1343 family)